MKKKLAALVTVLIVFTALCIPLLSASANTSGYVTDGLEALYIGNNNTGIGQDKNATVWKDLSGKGRDITNVPKDNNNYFTDTGYHLNTIKVFFPLSINDIVNGQEFTVEMVLGDLIPKGTEYLTFINCNNDNFSLFRRNAGDLIEVKTNNFRGERPEKAGGLEYFKNSTVTVTYKVGGKCKVYVDGEFIVDVDVTKTVNVDTDKQMWFGHNEANKNYETEFRSIRFYSKELTAAQVKANYEIDKEILGKPYQGEDTSSPTSSSEPVSSAVPSSSSSSSQASSSVSSTSSVSSASSVASSTTSTTAPETGDMAAYSYAVVGLMALVSAMLIIRRKNAVR